MYVCDIDKTFYEFLSYRYTEDQAKEVIAKAVMIAKEVMVDMALRPGDTMSNSLQTTKVDTSKCD